MQKILITDDDSDFRAVVKEVFEGEGFLITEAAGGLSAIGEFLSDQPDAVILDHHMPHMSGIETLIEMRKLNPCVPVIMVTGTQDPDIVRQAALRGSSGFVTKPLNFGDLICKVRKSIENVQHNFEI
jgi:two-component system chemotaxis response regulator CheY